jgi:DNA-binding MarR family transcriptional regulator
MFCYTEHWYHRTSAEQYSGAMTTDAVAATRSPDPLDHDLGWMLGVVFRAYVKAVDHVISDLPGGPRGYQLLAAAVRDEAGNQGAIAEELGIDRTVLTYLIDDLERLELVVRRPDPADRRSRLIVATDNGRAVWEQRQEALRRVESHLLSALAPEDAATFRALLQRLACGAQARDPVESLCEVVEHLEPTGAAAPTPTRRARRNR